MTSTLTTETLNTAVALEGVTKTYSSGPSQVTALRDVSLSIEAQSFTAIMGPSGSGKSTFLNCAAGLDGPTSGRVVLGGTVVSDLKRNALTNFRRDHVGFVFQAYNLLPHLTVEQNIALPLMLGGRSVDREWRDYVVGAVGMADLLGRKPQELSGGQQQRAAIARALVARPHAVFADEPTGALDSHTAHQVLELLKATARDARQTVVMVTHDPIAASHADRVLFLADGRFVGHLDDPTADAVAERLAHLGSW